MRLRHSEILITKDAAIVLLRLPERHRRPSHRHLLVPPATHPIRVPLQPRRILVQLPDALVGLQLPRRPQRRTRLLVLLLRQTAQYVPEPISLWRKSWIRPGPGAVEFRTLNGMAMGKRPATRQASPMWVETADLPRSDGHPFFERLNRVLADSGFDAFVEGLCAVFYADRLGRPSLRPGRYFRMLFIGYFEGLSSERGIAWRVSDSLSLRSFLDLDVTEGSADHSTLSRTRRLIDVETHVAVFTWVLERLSAAGLVKGEDGRRRCDDAGSERGDAEHRAVATGRHGRWGVFSFPLYERLKAGAPEFEDITAFDWGGTLLSVRRQGAEDAGRPVRAQYVSGSYFSTLGVGALSGRLFAADDDRPAAPPVVVLSHRMWQGIAPLSQGTMKIRSVDTSASSGPRMPIRSASSASYATRSS